jgi:hypothetical protein
MTVFLYILAIALMLLALYMVALNWGCVIVSIRNKRRGIDRHHSTLPLMSFVFAGSAFFAWPGAGKMWIMIIPLLDIANWYLLWLPVMAFQYFMDKISKDGKRN